MSIYIIKCICNDKYLNDNTLQMNAIYKVKLWTKCSDEIIRPQK